MVLSPADSKAVGDIRWREPLCWLCVGAQRSGYPASRGGVEVVGKFDVAYETNFASVGGSR
jgi:hypothetical protein